MNVHEKENKALLEEKKNLFDFMQSSPLKGSGIKIEREDSGLREINF